MKKLFITLMFLALPILAQDAMNNNVHYYGDLDPKTDSLQIAVGSADAGEYSIPNQPIIIAVDSNWTASNIGFKIYNELEDTWELLCDEDGTVIEYAVAVGSPVRLKPWDMAGLKTIKFSKVTSGSAVNQSGSVGNLQITTIRFN